MTATIKQFDANRANALASTGPRTANGKKAASRNATRHGILSGRLLLDDEDAETFQDFSADLNAALRPVGALEASLVERIAVTLWRQRRLVAAETASIGLQREPEKIATALSRYWEALRSLGRDDIEPFPEREADWSRRVIEEVEALDEIDIDSLAGKAPLVFGQLTEDVEDVDGGIPACLAEYKNGLTGYIDELVNWCRTELGNAEERPRLIALAEKVRTKSTVLSDDALDLFTRYQTSLDNQLARLLRTLRDTQEWRLKTLEPIDHPDESQSVETG